MICTSLIHSDCNERKHIIARNTTLEINAIVWIFDLAIWVFDVTSCLSISFINILKIDLCLTESLRLEHEHTFYCVNLSIQTRNLLSPCYSDCCRHCFPDYRFPLHLLLVLRPLKL